LGVEELETKNCIRKGAWGSEERVAGAEEAQLKTAKKKPLSPK